MLRKIRSALNNYQIIAIVYILVILFGTLLLSLPISSKDGKFTPFIDSLFTSASATCTTGLAIYDTFTKWSLFGQIVILLLFQLGGLGFMTLMSIFFIYLKKQSSLSDKVMFMQSTGNYELRGTKRLIRQIIFGTLIIESAGALLLAIRFCQDFGFWKGLYFSVFHSVSAFCNAGFDLMGIYKPDSSLSAYAGDPIVSLVIVVLIIAGGLGFLVWSDIIKNKFDVKRYSLHTKIVVIMTGALTLLGTLLFFAFENNASLAGRSPGDKFLISLFHSVAPRTAGFFTVDINSLSESGRVLTMLYMFIGGSPGSTAGGIKTTTFMVFLLTILSTVRRSGQIRLFKRRLEDNVPLQATAVISLYLLSVVTVSMIINAIQPFQIKDTFFEAVSAIGTVGLSTGITHQLNTISKLLITLLMYGGRVGLLSLAMIFANKRNVVPINRPIEKIIIG